MQPRFSVALLVVLIGIAGCSGESMRDKTSAPVSPSHTLTVVQLSTSTRPAQVSTKSAVPATLATIETPSPIVTATDTPRPPTPPVSAWRISDDFLFDNKQFPDCQLPCWQGLSIGVSNKDDVQRMFDTAFGYDGSHDFFPQGIKGTISGIYVTGNQWILNDNPLHYLSVFIWVDDESYIFKGVEFSWINPPFDVYMNPQRVMSELGQPSHILTNIALTEATRTGVVKLVIIYNAGMAFSYTIMVPITITAVGNETHGKLELCLGGERWIVEEYYASFDRSAYIMEPITQGLAELNPIQHYFIGIELDAYKYTPLQESFGMTLEEVYGIVQQNGDACIYTNVF